MDNLPAENYLVPPVNSPRYRECAENIAAELANGSTITGVAFKYQIDRKTIHKWANHPHFRTLIEAKKNEIRDELLNRIKGFGEKNWLPNAWYLERNKAFQGEFAAPKARVGQGEGIQINIHVSRGSEDSDQVIINVGEQAPQHLDLEPDSKDR